jgi:hypothetical protein
VYYLDRPQFTLKQIAAAAGIEVATLRTWLQRKHFELGKKDQAASELGDAHLLSLRSALLIGTAVELARCGVHPRTAAKHALAFTLLGDKHRDPGEVFSGDGVYTALISHPGHETGQVMRFDAESPLVDLFFSQRAGGMSSAVVVFLNRIDRQMRTALMPAGDVAASSIKTGNG